MSFLDLSGNARIPLILKLMESISRSRDARAGFEEFVQGVRRMYGPRGYIALSTAGLPRGEYRVMRFLTHEGEEVVPPGMPWQPEAGRPVRHGGILGQIVGTPVPKLAPSIDMATDPVLGEHLAPYRSLMAVPTFEQGEVTVWTILVQKEADSITVEDLEQSLLRVNLTGTLLNNIRLSEELRRAQDWIQGEIESIAAIQRALLPSEVPDVDGLALATSFETFDRAGGDIFEFLRFGSGRRAPLAILIADASGHGPAAAVVTAMLHGILHTHRPRSAGDMLDYLNLHLHAKRVEMSFVTAFFGIYDPETRRMEYSRAGHPPPLWKSVRGEIRLLQDAARLPLGILPAPEYPTGSVQLEAGDSLLFYTDGITETVAPDGRQFGVEGLEEAVAACMEQAPDCMVRHIRRRVLEYENGARPRDDQTLVAARVY